MKPIRKSEFTNLLLSSVELIIQIAQTFGFDVLIVQRE